MTTVAPIVVFLFFLAPAVRLLRLASRTRRAPELWGGLYFLGASFGISLRVFGAGMQFEMPDLAVLTNSIGHASLATGTCAMAFFTQRVFHPESGFARAFAWSVVIAIAATTVWTFAGDHAMAEDSAAVIATNSFRIVPTGWAFFESFRYWRSMKKRERLGLSDPVVTNRFLLWSIWTLGVSLLPAVALVIRLVAMVVLGDLENPAEAQTTYQPQVMAFVRALFLVVVPASVVALMLAFFPPRPYLDRIRAKATNEA
ncbi:MAG: hypothetical protein NXI30_06570 [bacterium]|nr:hypothetical protein [bacterium]